jgi:hypothetical protein
MNIVRHMVLALLGTGLVIDVGAAEPAEGPLRVSTANPRYFSDPSGQIILLTGSHTWNNLVDMGRSDPPEPFDFGAYLDFLEEHGHNFIRLWAWDSTLWDTRANGSLGKDYIHLVAPHPWERTGPGEALDGRPKFDLTRFNSPYFERLQRRVESAGNRGIYVSVMLFEGWGMMHGNRRRASQDQWAWRSHPFHPENNVQHIRFDDSDTQVHRLDNPAVASLQAAYIRKVVDTVNDLDNVLYEVINEGGERAWDHWVVATLREYEATKPKQHPIGLTGHGAESLASMLQSSAEWVSPGRSDGYDENPPVWDDAHGKVSILDTDHIWGIGGNVDWVWKSFLRGHNPIFMDPYDGSVLGTPEDPRWTPIRQALGDVRRMAARVNLVEMHPAGALASTGYCLASPGNEYLVYAPDDSRLTVDLSNAAGEFTAHWFDVEGRQWMEGGNISGTGRPELEVPFSKGAILHLKSADR